MKYFLALFCMMNSFFAYSMDVNCNQLDEVTQAVLKYYLYVRKKEMLNENGIRVSTKKSDKHFIIWIDVENDSESELAILLRKVANNSPQACRTQCVAHGNPEVVHTSIQNYNRRSTVIEMRPFEVKATTQFTYLEFKQYIE